MRFLLMLLTLLSMSGCQRYGRKLFGVEEKTRVEYQDRLVNVHVDYGTVQSDHFVVANGLYERVGNSFVVELCTSVNSGRDVCVGIPLINPSTGVTITWLRQGSFISIYNAKTGSPNTPYYRITIIEGNSEGEN